MGGKVFSTGSNALFTPRMDPKVYEIILAHCLDALKALFPVIKSPTEAPEKTSFGDIDIIVSLEGSSFIQEQIDNPQRTTVWAAIEKKLKAVQVFQEGKLFRSKNIAIPWPIDIAEDVMAHQLAVESKVEYKAESKSGKASNKAGEPGHKADPKRRFVQVDIQLCSTNQELEWRVFKHDHGDMWNILGAIIRPYGLTANEEGLYIRIPEMEQIDKKKARVFLTDSPTKVLEFVMREGHSRWAKRFPSVDTMFDYAARCKWFLAWLAHENEKNATGAKDNLKASDRQRISQRPVFARWVEEYLPKQIVLSRSSFGIDQPARNALRDEVRAAAFVAFPGAEDRYIQQLAAWNKEQTRIFVKNKLIKEDMALPESIERALPEPHEGSSIAQVEKNWRGVLRSALIKLIMDECTDFECVHIAPPHLRDEHGVLIVEDVKDWIEKSWETVGRAAWAAHCARAAENMRAKEVKWQKLEEDEAAQRLLVEQHAAVKGEER